MRQISGSPITGRVQRFARPPARRRRGSEPRAGPDADRSRPSRNDTGHRAASAIGEARKIVPLVEDVRDERLDVPLGPIKAGEGINQGGTPNPAEEIVRVHMLERADQFDLLPQRRRCRALVSDGALNVRFDVRPGRPGIAGGTGCLELGSNRQARPTWSGNPAFRAVIREICRGGAVRNARDCHSQWRRAAASA